MKYCSFPIIYSSFSVPSIFYVCTFCTPLDNVGFLFFHRFRSGLLHFCLICFVFFFLIVYLPVLSNLSLTVSSSSNSVFKECLPHPFLPSLHFISSSMVVTMGSHLRSLVSDAVLSPRCSWTMNSTLLLCVLPCFPGVQTSRPERCNAGWTATPLHTVKGVTLWPFVCLSLFGRWNLTCTSTRVTGRVRSYRPVCWGTCRACEQKAVKQCGPCASKSDSFHHGVQAQIKTEN